MDRLPRAAVLTRLAQLLREKGSWCGETHLQKAVYLLQHLLRTPLGFPFILYKHGPFSYDLRDELTSLRADRLLVLEAQPDPYGPKLAPTEQARHVQEVFAQTVAQYEPRLQFVAGCVGDKGVSQLERLATALYATEECGADATVELRAERLHEYKPHVPVDDARDAMREMDRLIEQAGRIMGG